MDNDRISVSPSTPLYLYAHFRDDDVAHLRLSYATDSATNWREVNPQGSFSATALRDPSIVYIPATKTFYFIVTPVTGTQVQFFSSVDLVNYSTITKINMTEYVTGATTVWAPEWWHDPQNGKYYFFVSLSTTDQQSTSSTASMSPYLVQFDPATASVIGAAQLITLLGTTQGRTFDYFPYYDGSRYYILYVDQQPGGTGGNVTQPIAYATSNKLEGPYTQQTIPGTDYFGLGTFHSEAPTIVKLGEKDCVRIIFDTWVTATSGARQYTPVFRDSCTNAGPMFAQTSLVNGPKPLQIVASEHGTVITLTDSGSAATVFRAVAQTAAFSTR